MGSSYGAMIGLVLASVRRSDPGARRSPRFRRPLPGTKLAPSKPRDETVVSQKGRIGHPGSSQTDEATVSRDSSVKAQVSWNPLISAASPFSR